MSESDYEFDYGPPPHLSIIPAAPGYRVIYDVDGILSVGEDIIGWRIETRWEEGRHHSEVRPVLISGMAPFSVEAVLHPDETVTLLGQRHASIAGAQASHTRLNKFKADKLAQMAAEERAR